VGDLNLKAKGVMGDLTTQARTYTDRFQVQGSRFKGYTMLVSALYTQLFGLAALTCGVNIEFDSINA
jgi:hypothetical protein